MHSLNGKLSKPKSLCELDLAGLNQSLWLVKIPKFVSEIWQDSVDGEELGKLNVLKVSNGPNKEPTKKLNITLQGPSLQETGVNSIDFTLEELGKSSNASDTFAFIPEESSTNNNNINYAVLGKCTKNLVLKPKDSQIYHNIRKKRLLAENTRKETKSMDISEVASRVSAASYIINMSSTKRVKQDVDTNAIKSKIFQLFSTDSKQLFADILSYCKDVPGITKENLKSVLENYATFHMKGQYRQYWELKTEFKDYSKK